MFDEVNKNFTNISVALLILAILLIVITFLLVNSTLRIALFSQRFLIRSMQLVGAKKWFIQRPFLIRAIGYGLLSSIVASILLWGFSIYAQKRITDLSLLHNQEHFLTLLAALLGDGDTRSNVEYFFLDSQVFKDVTRRIILISKTTWKVNFLSAKRITN